MGTDNKKRFYPVFGVLGILVALFWNQNALAGLALNDVATDTQVATQLQGPGITITNFSKVTGVAQQYGIFTGGSSSTTPGPQIGIDTGVFMTTSRANATGVQDGYGTTTGTRNAVKGANDAPAISDVIGTIYSDPQLTGIDSQARYDPIILKMKATPAGSYLKVSFVFASDEYPEFVCTVFNDTFGMFIKPASAADIPANWKNIGVLPGTSTPIAVNTINGGTCGGEYNAPRDSGVTQVLTNSAYYVNNGTGSTPANNTNLQYDGFTIPFIVETPVTPNTVYDVKVALADSGDAWWDGALFIKWLSSSNYLADVDLELDLQADNLTPNAGNTVKFTLTINNKGQDAASGAQVSFPMPAGFTYVSDTAGGNYNAATGIWTIPTSLAATTGTSSIQITTTAGGSGSVNAFAQVTTVNANDIDSTPNNGAQSPAEDDEDTVTLAVTPSVPSGPAFSCTADAYMSVSADATANTSLYKIVKSGASYTLQLQGTGANYNALAYNSVDNYMYAIGNSRNLLRVFSDGTTQNLGNVTGLPAVDGFRYIAADMDAAGNLYVADDPATSTSPVNSIYVVNVNSVSVTQTISLSPAIPYATSAYDPAYSGAYVNDLAYSVADNRIYAFIQSGHLYKINPATGASTLLGSSIGVPGSGFNTSSGIFGAVFADQSGGLYGIDNITGDLYSFNRDTGAMTYIATAQTGSFNDGAACALATLFTTYDFSDAPATYGTPKHTIVASLKLGSTAPDAESAAQPNTAATGDDTNGTDDEDAITSFPALTAGATTYSLSNIPVTNTTGSTATLYGWVDFNLNGRFDGNEAATATVANGATSATLNWTGLTGVTAGASYMRLRLTTQALTNANSGNLTLLDTRSGGAASDGEVEDYVLTIVAKGIISGTVFQDDDQSNVQDGGEPGIDLITVSLYSDNGTPTDITDDTLVTSVETSGGGTYSFTDLDPGTYRVIVDTADTDLPAGALIGTTHPKTGVTVTAGNTTTVNFGFDIFTCVPGGGTTDGAITSFISKEVDGGSVASRNEVDTLDDTWRSAAGLPATGTLVPWLGYTARSLNVSEPALFSTYGNAVDVTRVNIQPASPCLGTAHTLGAELSTSSTMQDTAPRPASLYDVAGQPAFWTDSGGDSQTPNAVRFTFANPVKSFGAWFGDLETRTDGNARPAYLRLLDSSGNRIGNDIPVEPTDLFDGSTTSAVDQNLCGSVTPGTDLACGNQSTRWVGFVDSAASARIKHVVVIVGDDDFGDNAGTELISFIGMDIVQEDFGDAPASYGDAIHWLSVLPQVYLGTTSPDKETQSQHAANGGIDGLGDDNNGDDEDGVANFPALNSGDKDYSLNVVVNNRSGSSARLVGWIDFNRNGVFDSNEAATTTVASGANDKTVALTWKTLPAGLQPGASYLRLRLTTDSSIATGTASTSLATGTANNGEVEDYPLTIASSGFTLSGTVYKDLNVNAVNDTEAGIKNVTMVLYDTANGTCRSTRTGADGSYRFSHVPAAAVDNYVVYEAAAENYQTPSQCPPAANDPTGYLSSTANTLLVTVTNADVTGIDFGDVQGPTFELDNQQAILPNSAVAYPHVFTTQADGTVLFSLAGAVANPAGLNWGAQLYRDTNCDAQLDGGDTLISGSLAVNAGDQVCLLAKVVSPANAGAGATHTLSVQSAFSYAGSTGLANDVQTHTDITTVNGNSTPGTPVNPSDPVAGEGKLSLVKSVWNVTRNSDGSVALPGETLLYTIHYQNVGNGSLYELLVQDSIPEFTQLAIGSLDCTTDQPAELPACTPLASGNGGLEWRWAASSALLPGSSGSVSYQVVIE